MLWPFDRFWPQVTFGLHQKQNGLSTQHKQSTCLHQIHQLLCLNYSVYKVLTIWSLLTLNDLWPRSKTTEIIYSMWAIYMLSMRSVAVNLAEIQCLQSFYHLTSGDPKWPLTSTTHNSFLPLTIGHLHTKYRIYPSFLPWDLMFRKFSEFDPRWPQMTFDLDQKQ